MKRIFLISISILICNLLMAQPPAPGSNVANNHINKFEGTWQWVSGNDTVILRLKKYQTSNLMTTQKMCF